MTLILSYGIYRPWMNFFNKVALIFTLAALFSIPSHAKYVGYQAKTQDLGQGFGSTLQQYHHSYFTKGADGNHILVGYNHNITNEAFFKAQSTSTNSAGTFTFDLLSGKCGSISFAPTIPALDSWKQEFGAGVPIGPVQVSGSVTPTTYFKAKCIITGPGKAYAAVEGSASLEFELKLKLMTFIFEPYFGAKFSTGAAAEIGAGYGGKWDTPTKHHRYVLASSNQWVQAPDYVRMIFTPKVETKLIGGIEIIHDFCILEGTLKLAKIELPLTLEMGVRYTRPDLTRFNFYVSGDGTVKVGALGGALDKKIKFFGSTWKFPIVDVPYQWNWEQNIFSYYERGDDGGYPVAWPWW